MTAIVTNPLPLPSILTLGDTAYPGDEMRAYGLTAAGRPKSLRIAGGVQAHLTSAGESVLRPMRVETPSARIFKQWVGVDDETAARMTSPPAVALPESEGDLSPAAIERAAWHFLFRDSRPVASYEAAVDSLGPFPAAVYRAGDVVIAPGGSLIVSGVPAVLLFDSLTIEAGGTLQLFAVTRGVFGRLVRRGPDAASA